MDDFDAEAHLLAHKILAIIFIVLIVLINGLLIFKIVRKSGFLYKPRSLILISLAIGDIVVALFPLVLCAKLYYEGGLSLSCATSKTMFVYMTFLIHFVYSVGLIAIAVELVYRYKRQILVVNNYINIVKSVSFSAMPWLLGLIVVLPLTMAGTNEKRILDFNVFCLYVTRKRYLAMFGVSVVLPVCLALIVSIVVPCIRLLPAQYTGQVIAYHGNTQDVAIAAHNTSNMNQQYPMSGTTETQQMLTATPNYELEKSKNSKVEGPESNPLIQQYPPSQYPAQQYPPNQYPAQHYPPSQYPAQQYPQQQYYPQQQMVQPNVLVANQVYFVQPQNPGVPAFDEARKEKKTLLSVCVFLFVCVMPNAIYTMGNIGSESSITTSFDLILQTTFFWLSLFRSMVTPLIWICEKKLLAMNRGLYSLC